MSTTQPTIDRVLISIKDVIVMMGISRTTLHRVREKDSSFPKPIKDGPHRSAHAYFVKSEIEAWLQNKMDSRHAA